MKIELTLRRQMGGFLLKAATGALLLLLTASSGYSQQAQSVQRIGNIVLKADRYLFTPGTDGRLHVTMVGNPALNADLRTVSGTTDHYEIRAARTIEYTLAAGGGAIANAIADGAVHIEVHSPLPPAAGSGERVLVVTGDHGVFNNQPQDRTETADITGNPHLVLYDPQLASPAVLSNAATIHVNLMTRQFEVTGDGTHQPTMTIDPKQTPQRGAPPAPTTGHVRLRGHGGPLTVAEARVSGIPSLAAMTRLPSPPRERIRGGVSATNYRGSQ